MLGSAVVRTIPECVMPEQLSSCTAADIGPSTSIRCLGRADSFDLKSRGGKLARENSAALPTSFGGFGWGVACATDSGSGDL